MGIQAMLGPGGALVSKNLAFTRGEMEAIGGFLS